MTDGCRIALGSAVVGGECRRVKAASNITSTLQRAVYNPCFYVLITTNTMMMMAGDIDGDLADSVLINAGLYDSQLQGLWCFSGDYSW